MWFWLNALHELNEINSMCRNVKFLLVDQVTQQERAQSIVWEIPGANVNMAQLHNVF